ncbi:Cystathionine beta-lyase [Burkholderia lata]|uniref:Cystathionine beta-lyase n=1 Tax=Burkholderia lata (strain ATCC 17760 / DSM 23089 / LMG 22485 / NCIMB 9086 / R18194 / 383) TaxID=482957 RepID=A0A6P2V7D4_BURL3|nr:cystathionine beta-lyase [Burkholderia lata]VWC76280.1 Cystathionine beta-lyase [Burkholderia lata]
MESTKKVSEFDVSTQLTMLGRDPSAQYGFVNAPLYKGSTVVYKTVDDFEQKRQRFTYGTAGSPTIANLEDAWTHLAGAAGTVLSPTGLGSVALALLTTTKAGDHILVPDSVYRPTRVFCNGLLARYGVETSYYDPLVGAGIEELIKPNTSTIFIESPGSRSMDIQDVPSIVGVAKKHGIRTIADNTWATPIFFQAHRHGIDISVEAGTKYLGGHSDLLLGLASATEELWPALRATYDAMAMLPGADDCVLALRGLRTMHLRLKEAERKALEVATWLKARPEVHKVLHPAFEDCPGHEFWKRDFLGASGLFSVVLHEHFSRNGLKAMLDGMSIFSMGLSWGGYESLVVPFNANDTRTATKWPYKGIALRLQIGLEDIGDLKRDLEQGLNRLVTCE